MKNPRRFSLVHLARVATTFTFVAAAFGQAPVAKPAGATPHPAGPVKVRIIVRENNVATTAGGTAPASPAPAAAKPVAKPAAPGAPPPPAQLPGGASDAEKYTRTTKKSLTVAVANATSAAMDVNVKTTFLAKDEAGKHDVVPETTVEKALSLPPGKSQEFTTDEVSFSHTSAHLQVDKPTGGKGKAKAKLVPASGHAYFGYKVEVFQGNDLVGLAASEAH